MNKKSKRNKNTSRGILFFALAFTGLLPLLVFVSYELNVILKRDQTPVSSGSSPEASPQPSNVPTETQEGKKEAKKEGKQPYESNSEDRTQDRNEEEAIFEDFAWLSQKTLSTMPHRSDLKTLKPEEAHRVPKIILAAGLQLGEVAESLEKHPQLKPEGLKFYRVCAENIEFPASIRASCYTKFYHLLGSKKSEALQVDPEIKRIADQL